MIIIKNKRDAIGHIDQLYPIGQSDKWDKVWLEEIQDFGIQHLPKELIFRMAKLMLQEEGKFTHFIGVK